MTKRQTTTNLEEEEEAEEIEEEAREEEEAVEEAEEEEDLMETLMRREKTEEKSTRILMIRDGTARMFIMADNLTSSQVLVGEEEITARKKAMAEAAGETRIMSRDSLKTRQSRKAQKLLMLSTTRKKRNQFKKRLLKR